LPLLVLLAQRRSQRRDTRQRKLLLKRETQLRKQLSFTANGVG
jgi:hypothetical protein